VFTFKSHNMQDINSIFTFICCIALVYGESINVPSDLPIRVPVAPEIGVANVTETVEHQRIIPRNETEDLLCCESSAVILVHALERYIAFSGNHTTFNESVKEVYRNAALDTLLSTLDPEHFKFVDANGDMTTEPGSYNLAHRLMTNASYAERSDCAMSNPKNRTESSFNFLIDKVVHTPKGQDVTFRWILRLFTRNRRYQKQAFITEIAVEQTSIP